MEKPKPPKTPEPPKPPEQPKKVVNSILNAVHSTPGPGKTSEKRQRPTINVAMENEEKFALRDQFINAVKGMNLDEPAWRQYIPILVGLDSPLLKATKSNISKGLKGAKDVVPR